MLCHEHRIYYCDTIIFRIQFLRHLRDFFQVLFKMDVTKRDGDDDDADLRLGADKILMTCAGAGFKNLNKVTL